MLSWAEFWVLFDSQTVSSSGPSSHLSPHVPSSDGEHEPVERKEYIRHSCGGAAGSSALVCDPECPQCPCAHFLYSGHKWWLRNPRCPQTWTVEGKRVGYTVLLYAHSTTLEPHRASTFPTCEMIIIFFAWWKLSCALGMQSSNHKGSPQFSFAPASFAVGSLVWDPVVVHLLT